MGHIPYGYRIENGKAVVDEIASERVKELFSGYLAGLSLKGAAKKAGIDCYHATVSKMLQNKHYLGDEFYPPIIDEETFEKARVEKRYTVFAIFYAAIYAASVITLLCSL